MSTRILLAVAVLSLCSTSVFAQTEQVFVSFGEGANLTNTATFDADDESGSAFIFSAADFDFDAFDLEFSTTTDDVIEFTGAEVFNPTNGTGQSRFERNVNAIRETVNATDGRLFGVAVTATGVNPALGAAGLDPEFDVEANAFRIARIDFDIVGIGTADITLASGINEFFSDLTPDTLFQPTLGNGTLTVTGPPPPAVPEPSAMGILALGLVGFVARRRR